MIEPSSEENSIQSASKSDASLPVSSLPVSSLQSLSVEDKSSLVVSDDNLKDMYGTFHCENDRYSKECNKFLLKKELLERNYLEEHNEENVHLYPNLNDPLFNIKIAEKKEFNETKYDGKIYNIKEHADMLANADFELSPHQAFVKNFLSFQTPYSSLLLFHGLGTGKTCSAIGVCEEMRDYMKQTSLSKRIIIVASENVQDNFKLQLFDERKLQLIDGIWNIKSCIGNKLLKEINPTNMKNFPKEKVISQIKNLINHYYIFLGYGQFANYIIKTMNYDETEKQKFLQMKENPDKKTKIQMLKEVKAELNSKIIRRLKREFDNRCVVIDEVHNIRKADDNENKKVAVNLEMLVKACSNMRFLLLSATPMYNNFTEIVWLLNLMNTNDKRGKIEVKDVFDKKGEFKKDGEELLIRKATGYISFVRGENPYTFPYRINPNEFDPENSFERIQYPLYQMNLKKIPKLERKRILPLFLTTIGGCENCGECQYCAYRYIIYHLRHKNFSITTKTGEFREMPSFENMDSFGYTLLKNPIESLIISYPHTKLREVLQTIPKEHYSERLSDRFSEQSTTPTIIEELPGLLKDVTEKELDEKPADFKPKADIIIESDSEDENVDIAEKLKTKLKNCPKGSKRNKITKECEKIKTKLIIESDDEEELNAQDAPDAAEEKIITKLKNCPKGTRRNKITKECEKKLDKKPADFKPKANIIIESDSEDENVDIAEKLKTKLKNCPKGSKRNKITKECEKKLSGGENTPSPSVSPRIKTAIDPNSLTGRQGLERMMTFIDNKNPPQKGEFEYKQTTLDNHGKIFSYKNIGKYSSKIKTILNKIYNKEENVVSEGIVLIYSQYIDSGLIPMALALEEFGFTRYGKEVKPLFKKQPTELVDVRTMTPPKDKKTDFMPARYAMITGETRLSPDNEYEVKGLTNANNVEGNKVKVVLISRAGSEGIDFKYIRQVHFLDPWYNTNRPEQVIGRAIRNFSHKDLPFEKRNVQIFMHGTILEDNKEESADLYIYRVAEFKAIQIGKITRILKETAVDCVINSEQTNFTQEKINATLTEPITQILSNHQVINNFQIGDAPFSPACDYMSKCDYTYRPYKEIDEDNLNEDTYNEKFIAINSEKIMQRIRMLFKESFFYKKDILIKSVRVQKEYPIVQIYGALSQLIDDENEFIVDKYGRNGRLINIGEYYMFQPLELRDKNASIFERSVPIDYNHSMIKFDINPKLMQQKYHAIEIDLQKEDGEKLYTKSQQIIIDMQENIQLMKEYSKKTKVAEVKDDNWYKHCGISLKRLVTDFPDVRENIILYIIEHMIEMLLFEDKIELMNYIYSLQDIKEDSIEFHIKNYIHINTITTTIRKLTYNIFIMYNLKKRVIMILDNINKKKKDEDPVHQWVEMDTDTGKDIASTKEVKDYLSYDNLKNYNTITGFIGYGKKTNYLVFKTKDMTSKRDTGARCDESGKSNIIKKLNKIIGEEKYTTENTKQQKDAEGNVTKVTGSIELCIITEILLRHYDKIKKEDKRWFLTPELAIWYKIYTIHN